jgi:hypothetical protein
MAGSHQLSDMSWKQNAGGPGSSTLSPSVGGIYNARDEQNNPAAGQPLLAELGGDTMYNPHGQPVELAGGTAYHPQPQYGYNAQSPQTQHPYTDQGQVQGQQYQAYQAPGQQQQQQQQQQSHPTQGPQQGYQTYASFSPPYHRSNF